MVSLSSGVIVLDGDIVRIAVPEPERQTPAIVDGHRVATAHRSFQRMETASPQRAQRVGRAGCFKGVEKHQRTTIVQAAKAASTVVPLSPSDEKRSNLLRDAARESPIGDSDTTV